MALQLYKIATTELSTSTGTVTFSNIPQGYTDLKVVMSARSNYAANGSGASLVFNGSTTGYTYRQIYGFSGGAGSVGGTSTGQVSVNIPGANFTANSFASLEFYVPNFTSSNSKPVSVDSVRSDTSTSWQLDMFAYLWSGSASISTITINENNSSTFVPNSTFTLYGIL